MGENITSNKPYFLGVNTVQYDIIIIVYYNFSYWEKNATPNNNNNNASGPLPKQEWDNTRIVSIKYTIEKHWKCLYKVCCIGKIASHKPYEGIAYTECHEWQLDWDGARGVRECQSERDEGKWNGVPVAQAERARTGEIRDWNNIVEVFLDPNMYVRRMCGRSFIRCLFVVARGCFFNFPRDLYIYKIQNTYRIHIPKKKQHT